MSDITAQAAPRGASPATASLPWRAAAVGITVSLAFTAFFIWGLHWEDLYALPEQVDLAPVFLAAAILFLEFPLRALRWSLLLSPLQPASGAVPLTVGRLFRVTCIGFMANNLLPARAGELVRPWLAARRGKLPFESVFVTCLIERGFDVLGLVSVAVLTSLLLPGAGASGLDVGLMDRLDHWASLLGLASALGLLALAGVALSGRRARPLVERLARALPAPVASFGLRVFDGLLGGLASLETGWRPAVATALSVVIWVNGAAAIWTLMGAFNLHLPFAAACFLSLSIALAVVLPQAPGFLGVFQVATQLTLMAWGVEVGAAQGFAIVFWLVSFVPVTTAGLFALWEGGLSLRALVAASRGGSPAQEPDDARA